MRNYQHFKRILRVFMNEEGTTAIEMAFVLPALLLIIMGTIEFGIIFHLNALMNYAGNEAARLGKTGYSYNAGSTREEQVVKSVRDRMSSWVKTDDDLVVSVQSYGSFDDLGVTGAGSVGAGGGNEIVLYSITLNWKILTPMVGQLLGGQIPITARVLVKNESF